MTFLEEKGEEEKEEEKKKSFLNIQLYVLSKNES
jgi:hypothetical protein